MFLFLHPLLVTARKTADEVLSHFEGMNTLALLTRTVAGKLAHVVLCDGAPDVTGMHDIDEYIQV